MSLEHQFFEAKQRWRLKYAISSQTNTFQGQQVSLRCFNFHAVQLVILHLPCHQKCPQLVTGIELCPNASGYVVWSTATHLWKQTALQSRLLYRSLPLPRKCVLCCMGTQQHTEFLLVTSKWQCFWENDKHGLFGNIIIIMRKDNFPDVMALNTEGIPVIFTN